MTDEEKKVLDTILSLCQREGISPFQIDYKVHNEIKVSNVKGVITTDIKENVVSVRYRGMYEERLGTLKMTNWMKIELMKSLNLLSNLL